MVPVAAMDEHPAGPAVIDNKATTAPHGSPTPAPVVVEKQQHQQQNRHEHPQQQPSPKMQSAPPLPPVQQHQQQQHHQHQHPQYYGAPNGQQLSSSDYRGSPPGAVPMSLPSIQHFEGANMQSQPQYLPPSHMNGAPSMMHAQAYNSNMVQYQQQPLPPTMPSNAPNGHNGMMRYPIPPQAPMDVRQMSGGRHKKEIKRRTKSGCLTCRKRRIKCDEAHPECRNCQKSKRTCMGYDPVYKNDRVPSIQPAPVSSAPPSKPSPILSTVPSNAYPPYQGAGGAYIQQLPPSAGHMDGNMPYHTSVDSVIAEQDAKLPSVANTNGYVPSVQMARRFVKLTIDELFDLNEIPPQLPVRNVPDLLSQEVNKELEDFYNFKYAHALDKLFETSWYTTQGFATLTADHQLHEFAVQCMEEMRPKPGSYGQTAPSPALASLEARLVWSLAALPRVHHLHNTNSASPSSLTLELLQRLDTVEHLLTGRYLDVARVPPPPASVVEMSGEQDSKSVQQAFWYHLGRFTSLRDDQGDAQTLDDVSRELGNMRVILEVLENRDVLYSIAVARHIGGRIPDWSPQTPHLPLSNDPTDDVNKLHVAYSFVQTEDQRGTSQVIQRICSMSLRSWSLQQRQQ